MSEIQLDLLAARQRVNLLKAKKRLVDENGVAFYKPHPKQDMFHRAAIYKRRYARTGNRFGKSEMAAAEDVAFALGERPWLDKDDPGRYIGIPKHSTKGCIIVQDWDKAHEIFTNPEPGESQGKLFGLLPADKIVATKKGRSGTGIVEIVVQSIHGGHSTINMETVRSYQANKMGLESSDWDWLHVDEPIPQGMWIAMSRGLVDRNGSAWFTCTPLEQPWINDYFIPNSKTRATFTEPFINDAKDMKKWILTGSSSDNPHISKEALKAFLADVSDPAERACREHGIPLNMSGLIYKDFKPELHIYRDAPFGWIDAQRPPSTYTIRMFIDPHPKTPHAVLTFATSPTGQTFIFRELFRAGLISDVTEHIKAQIEGYLVEDILVDPIAYIENPITGSCMADEFYACGLPVTPAPKDLGYGILKTSEKWRERDRHGNPTLFVHENCEEFLYEIDRYCWDQKKEKPVDFQDHMMENLYRAVLTGLSYVEPEGRSISYAPEKISMSSWRNNTMRLQSPLPSTKKRGGRQLNHSQRYL